MAWRLVRMDRESGPAGPVAAVALTGKCEGTVGTGWRGIRSLQYDVSPIPVKDSSERFQRNSETGDAGKWNIPTKNPDNFRPGFCKNECVFVLLHASEIPRDEFAQIVRHILVLRFDLLQILHTNTKTKKLA